MTVDFIDMICLVLVGNVFFESVDGALIGMRSGRSALAAAIACTAYVVMLCPGEPWESVIDISVYLAALVLWAIWYLFD